MSTCTRGSLASEIPKLLPELKKLETVSGKKLFGTLLLKGFGKLKSFFLWIPKDMSSFTKVRQKLESAFDPVFVFIVLPSRFCKGKLNFKIVLRRKT
jgi:hypothetical protein